MSHKGEVRTVCDSMPRTRFKRPGSVWRCTCGQFYVLQYRPSVVMEMPGYKFWAPVGLEDIK